MIITNNVGAQSILDRMQVLNGQWVEYGSDARLTIEEVDYPSERAGDGFRARFMDNPHGGDYGWGPLASNEAEAIALFLAAYIAADEDQ